MVASLLKRSLYTRNVVSIGNFLVVSYAGILASQPVTCVTCSGWSLQTLEKIPSDHVSPHSLPGWLLPSFCHKQALLFKGPSECGAPFPPNPLCFPLSF